MSSLGDNKGYVIVTGASGDIGLSIARVLSDNGYKLCLVGNSNMDKLMDFKESMPKDRDIKCYKCDAQNPEEISSTMKSIFGECGEIYALINNAAVSYVGLLTDMSFSDWRELMSVNLDAVFCFTKEVVPHMVNNKNGRIINVSSVWGNVGASMEVAYSASKGGVNSFTKALAKELGPSNVSVNAVAFGMIDTKMNAHLSEDEKVAIANEIPFDRAGTPMEAANMIMQILNAPAYLTGQVITMDGGWI